MRGGANRLEWTPDMIAALRRDRGRGESILMCAEVIGVEYKTAYRKVVELGLNRRMNRGAIPGVRCMQERAA